MRSYNMPKFNPPPSFNFSNPSEWPDWKQMFERYRIATKLHKDEGIQVNSLIYAMGKEAEHIFKSLVFDEAGDEEKYEKIMQKKNVIHEHGWSKTRSW